MSAPTSPPPTVELLHGFDEQALRSRPAPAVRVVVERSGIAL